MKLNRAMILTSGLAAFVLAGCQDPDGTYNYTANGLAIGTAAGAAAGAAIQNYNNDKDCEDTEDESEEECKANNNTAGAAVGGTVGAMIGGAIGAQLEQQQQELQQELAGTGATITRLGDRLIVTLPEAITFPVDGTEVKSSLYGPLQDLATSANKYPNEVVQVVGHTDSTGSDAYNQNLSERRAQSVASILRADGVASSRIQTIGMGETAPIASNDTESGRQANRRVEINLVPIQQ